MRLPQAVRMPDDGHGPVWTRAKRKGGNPVVGFVGGLLALIGLITIGLAVLDGGFAKGGAQVDNWIAGIGKAVTGAKSKAVAMDNSQPVEPASAPASSQAASQAASQAPAAAAATTSTAPAAKP